jgi:hypothetical protein
LGGTEKALVAQTQGPSLEGLKKIA